ncbi:MAG: TSUP family transporter [Thermodesulfobacteriota bacterium]
MRRIRVLPTTLMILGLFTALALAGQAGAADIASPQAPPVVKKKVAQDIQKIPVEIQQLDKKLADPKLAPDQKKKLEKEKAGLAAALKKLQTPAGKPGFLGLLGGPLQSEWFYLWGFLWAIWVGWIFSTVGAFGGIMAGVGHITIFGLGDYAKSFGKGTAINKLITDSTRVSNQWLVGLSAIISSFNYYKMGRLVLPLGVCLGIGSVASSYLIPVLTAGKIRFTAYMGYFGLCVLLLGCFLVYQMTPRARASKKAAKEAAAAFEKEKGASKDQGVKVVEGSYGGMILALVITVLGAIWGNAMPSMAWYALIVVAIGVIIGLIMTISTKISFTFYGVKFSFRGFIPILGGLFIAALASFLGVGGGFLFVPFLTAVAGLPMFLVAGTSALAVLVGMIVSISTYMIAKDVPVQWGFIGAELVGIFIGSMIGPRTSKYLSDKWLNILFIILAVLVGFRYTLKGFYPEFYAGLGLP